jgi:hypothetical protein
MVYFLFKTIPGSLTAAAVPEFADLVSPTLFVFIVHH